MTCWVLLTRGPDRAAELAAPLEALGITVVPYPVLRERPVTGTEAWARAAATLDAVRWVVLTSPRAATAFAALDTGASTRRRVNALPVAAVGEATAEAARRQGWRVELTGEAGAADLAARLALRLAPGDAVLHLCGSEHRRELGESLAAAGVGVVTVPVYAMEEAHPATLPELPEGVPAAVVLSSPRATTAYLAATARRFAAAPHLAFGPTTARAAREAGLSVVTLRRPTPECIVEELCQICS